MRILPFVLLLALVAAASPEGGDLKAKIQAMLDEAALLDQAGRHDEAARLREEAVALKVKTAPDRGQDDDPRMQALRNLEKAIGALEKVEGCGDLAEQLRGTAERLRRNIKEADVGAEVEGDDTRWKRNLKADPKHDFWRRNLDTLRVARKALAEAGRHDGADLMGRAIEARELLLAGKPDMAERAMKEGPGEGDLAELLLVAAGCWREFKQPERAAQCEELGRHFQHRLEKERVEKTVKFAREQPGPGADDRMARLEERLDRMERMLHETLQRLERQERDGDHGRDGAGK